MRRRVSSSFVCLALAVLGGACSGNGLGSIDGLSESDAGSAASPSVSVMLGPTACGAGAVRPCHAGPPELEGVGICHAGTQHCADDGSKWLDCEGAVGPSLERCETPEDDDCDGIANEPDECNCNPGSTRGCYDGALATRGVGRCHDGVATCAPNGTWGACDGQTLPAPETCAPGELVDEDCDGQVDEEGCACVPGTTAACPNDTTPRIGACHPGYRVCADDGSGYGPCKDQVTPIAEICGNGIDDDCDGLYDPDEGCGCRWGEFVACYGGPPATRGAGRCRDGRSYCDVTATFSKECLNDVRPVRENCADPADEDCDGTIAPACVLPLATIIQPHTENITRFAMLSTGGVVMGAHRDSSPPYDTFIRALSPTGATLYEKTVPGAFLLALATGADDSTAIATWDSVLSGASTYVPGIRLEKRDASGNAIWSKFLAGNGGASSPYSVSMDATGAISLAGTSSFDPGADADAGVPPRIMTFVGRFSPSGELVYWRRFVGTALLSCAWSDDGTSFVALDGPGLAVDGGTTAAGMQVVSLGLDGATRWARAFDTHGNTLPLNALGSPQVAVHGSDVWVAGPYTANFQGEGVTLPLAATSAFLLHLDTSGGSIWARDVPAFSLAGVYGGAGVATLVGVVLTQQFPDGVGFGAPPPDTRTTLVRFDATGTAYAARNVARIYAVNAATDRAGRFVLQGDFSSSEPTDLGAGPLPAASSTITDFFTVLGP